MENVVIKSRDSQTSQLPSKSETLSGEEVKLPPSMKLRCSSKSPVDDGQEEQSQGYAIHPVGDNTNRCLLKEYLGRYQKALMRVSILLNHTINLIVP